MDFEVFDRRRASAKACFLTGSGDLLAPGLGLFARVPDFNDPYRAVLAESGYMKYTSGRRRVADPQTFPHLVVLVGRDSRLDDPCDCHQGLLD